MDPDHESKAASTQKRKKNQENIDDVDEIGLKPYTKHYFDYGNVVSPAAFEPLAGWVDNLNGPTGLMIGCGKGVIRSVLVDKKNKSEVIPVDYAINGLVVIPYEFNNHSKRPSEIPVYNITNAENRKQTMGKVVEMSKGLNKKYPLNAGLWYPDPCVTTSKLYHNFNVFMFHWVPAYFLDFLMFILGQKRFMVRVQQKISIGLDVLQFFTLHAWTFKSSNYEALWDQLTANDKLIFNMDMNVPQTEEEYMINCIKGSRRFILKEKDEDIPKARIHMKIQWAVDRICKTVIVGFSIYYIMKWTVTPALKEPLTGWVDNLNGPTGVLIGAGKGVIRSILCNGELKSEVIPVDIAINGLIVLPYHFHSLGQKPGQIPVYNITVDESKKHTWKWILDVGRDFGLKYPFEIGLWYPDGGMTMNKLYHKFCQIFFMWFPAYLVDFLLALFRQRRFMVRVQEKVGNGLDVLEFFTTRSWDFKSANFSSIFPMLTEKDRIIFKINTNDVDDMEYMKTCILGGRQFVMKEPLSSLPKARIQLKFMYALDRISKTLIITSLLYWVSLKLGIMDFIRANLLHEQIDFIKS